MSIDVISTRRVDPAPHARGSVHVAAKRHRGRQDNAATTLWLHLHFPALALEVLLRGSSADKACVLVAGEGQRRKVMLANRQAAILGIRPGMPLGAAHALGQVTVLERNAAAERRALDSLCLWAMQISSMVSAVAPDGLVIEIGGSLKLLGGLDALLLRLRRGMKRLGYRFDYAVAPTPLAATVLARAGGRAVVRDRHQLQSALAALPIEALRLEAAPQASLSGLGVRQLGDCRRLPRDGLARRFSPAFVDMLDRLFGHAPDPRLSFVIPHSFETRLELPWEVTNAQALLTAGERMLYELDVYLTTNAALTRHLRWQLITRDGEFEHFETKLTRPVRDYAHMLLLLRETLMRKTLRAPVRGLVLKVSDIVVAARPEIRDLFAPKNCGHDEGYAAFFDRLRSRCGEAALRSLGIRSAHGPEQAWCWRHPEDIVPPRKASPLVAAHSKPVRRPLWLLKQALPLTLQHGQPIFDGPLTLVPDRERIVNSWWDEVAIARDYFIATTSRGGRLWVYKDLKRTRAWYLHGIFE